jgi:cation diffusion facilitator CzcD-associated flavoprotein CzcO
MTTRDFSRLDYEVIVVGAGICGIYQLYRLLELGVSVTVLEKGSDLGGTWFWNRYPGARFDSESYGYGYSFSKELLEEWDWSERFAGQPETLRYLNYVADKFDLRPHMQFDASVKAAHFDDGHSVWKVYLEDGRVLTSRFIIMAIGLLSAATWPKYDGMDTFKGESFHTYDWPAQGPTLAGKRVAVIGAGSTGVQLIAEIADQVKDLIIFQRHPNWCAPLNNSRISPEEMASIKQRYDEIFELCARTTAGHLHDTDERSFYDLTPAERAAKWEQLYNEPGFGIWLGNFRQIFTDETAMNEMSEFMANKIRSRVNDPAIAEKLIPKDHGFGMKRVPLETGYYETYNRHNVQLVDLLETPIERITPTGIRTTDEEYEFDIIIYATGFDAVTGAYDRIGIRGVDGLRLRDKWKDGPSTFMGVMVNGFPNMIMPTGPQSGSASSNFPRGIESGVEWTTDLVAYMLRFGYVRAEATSQSEEAWTADVARHFDRVLLRNAKGWFNGYNANVEGHENGVSRPMIYTGRAPRYRKKMADIAENGYAGVDLA